MLPHRKDIWGAFPNSFVLFKPKDIVSGDFYFFAPALKGKTQNSPLGVGGQRQAFFIAAADCTGHGVPGGFMSMVGAERLTDAVQQSNNTSEILSLLNNGIKASLKQSDNENTTRDGMDIALCSFNKEMSILEYSGANRPLWIIRNENKQEIIAIKATKVAIGGLTPEDQIFENHKIDLNKEDSIYIFSDGYADQFSPSHKKLMTKKFKEILLSIQDRSMEEQKKYLDSFIENWKGSWEQTDDVLVIGIRV